MAGPAGRETYTAVGCASWSLGHYGPGHEYGVFTLGVVRPPPARGQPIAANYGPSGPLRWDVGLAVKTTCSPASSYQNLFTRGATQRIFRGSKPSRTPREVTPRVSLPCQPNPSAKAGSPLRFRMTRNQQTGSRVRIFKPPAHNKCRNPAPSQPFAVQESEILKGSFP